MQHLAKMTQLISLNITDNQISEKGVEILFEKLDNLESFMTSDIDAKLINREKIPQNLREFYIIGELETNVLEKPALKQETN